MNKCLLFLTLAALHIDCRGQAPQRATDTDPTPPASVPFRCCIEISIFSGGWMLRLWPTGGGRLIYGSNFMDTYLIPPNTFNFARVYALVNALPLSRGEGAAFRVGLVHTAKISALSKGVDGSIRVRALFATAEASLTAKDRAAAQRLKRSNPFY